LSSPMSFSSQANESMPIRPQSNQKTQDPISQDKGKILITGATGFVGTNLCHRFMVEKRPFLALVRSPVKAEERGLPKNSLLVGDLCRPSEWNLEGIAAVVHLGGLVRALNWQPFEEVNIRGTRRLVEHIKKLDPSIPFIHVSSLAAAGPSEDGGGSAASPASTHPCSLYGRSKMLSEVEVQRGGLPYTILRPCAVYGPWDQDILSLFKQVKRGFGLVAGPPSRFSLIYVQDLVEAILCALDGPKKGAIVPVAYPQAIQDAEWLEKIGEADKKTPRILRLPLCLASLVAWGGEGWARLRGRAALFGRDKFRELAGGSWLADTQIAEEVLGFRATTDFAEGFEKTWAWYREKGWL
jgi:nucleoside-diphosphate-sugar epimerase